MNFAVFVPRDPTAVIDGVVRGSALLGSQRVLRDEEVTLLTVAPAGRHESFADRCRRGERRQGAKQTSFSSEQLVCVGQWDSSVGELRLEPRYSRLLGSWIGHIVYRNDLEASDSASNERQSARMRARRHDMSGRPDLAARERSQHGIRHW